MAEFDEVLRPPIIRVWTPQAGDARRVARGIAVEALTRRALGVIVAIVVVVAALAAVLTGQWWSIPAAVVYGIALVGVIYWRTYRRCRHFYRPGVRWGVGFDDHVLRIADGTSEGVFRWSTISRVDLRHRLLIVKIVRGQRVAWPADLFGDELSAEIRRRVMHHNDPRVA